MSEKIHVCEKFNQNISACEYGDKCKYEHKIVQTPLRFRNFYNSEISIDDDWYDYDESFLVDCIDFLDVDFDLNNHGKRYRKICPDGTNCYMVHNIYMASYWQLTRCRQHIHNNPNVPRMVEYAKIYEETIPITGRRQKIFTDQSCLKTILPPGVYNIVLDYLIIPPKSYKYKVIGNLPKLICLNCSFCNMITVRRDTYYSRSFDEYPWIVYNIESGKCYYICAFCFAHSNHRRMKTKFNVTKRSIRYNAGEIEIQLDIIPTNMKHTLEFLGLENFKFLKTVCIKATSLEMIDEKNIVSTNLYNFVYI